MGDSRFWFGFILGFVGMLFLLAFVRTAWVQMNRKGVRHPVIILGGILLAIAAGMAISLSL